jgi:hypothetical protein
MPEKLIEIEDKPGVKGVIELAVSPGGKKCVVMTIEDKRWILLGSMVRRDAFDQGLYLHQQNIESRQGIPFDWRQSIAQDELIRIRNIVGDPEVVGVYVPAEKFDPFIEHAMRVTKPG